MKSQSARYCWGLLFVSLIAAAVRWVNIGVNQLWGDEALTAVIAGAPTLDLAMSPLDPTGPLYYWLHKFFIPFDADPTTARLISLACGVALIPAIYATGRQFLDRRSALLSAAIIAVAPLVVDFAQEARSYALLTLLTTGAVGFLLAAAKDEVTQRRRWKLAAFAVTSILALYTHLTAFLFVGSLCIVMMEGADRTLSSLRRSEVFSCWAAIALASLPEVWRIFQYTTQANAFVWLSSFSLHGFAMLLADEFLPFVKLYPNVPAYAVVTFMFLALVVVAVRRMRADGSIDRVAIWVLAAWLLQPALQWLVGYLVGPVLMTRTLNPVWPGFALTLGWLTISLSPRVRTWVEAALLAAYAASLFLTGTVRQKEDWGGATNEIAGAAPDVVVVCPAWKAPALVSAARKDFRPIIVMFRGGFRRANGAPTNDLEAGYRETVWRPQHERWLGASRLLQTETRMRRVSFVQSECDKGFFDTLGDASNAAVLRRHWVSARGSVDANPALGQPAQIVVDTYDLARPVTVQLLESRP